MEIEISLRFRVVWLNYSLSAWRNLAPLAIQNAPSEDSDQTARMRGLIWIFAGRTCLKVRFLTLLFKWAASCENVSSDMWTAKAQISLRIHAVWSRPSLSTNRIIEYQKMLQLRSNAWIRLRAYRMMWICIFCACWKALCRLERPKCLLMFCLSVPECVSLLSRMIEIEPSSRISTSDLLQHPWISDPQTSWHLWQGRLLY